jgi:quercetin dioxygenase-like cupin family protein
MTKFTEGELDSQARIHEMGTENSPQLFESQFPPHGEVNIHANAEDEIMFVLAGQMLVGNHTLGPGSSVFIAGNTLYSFKAGPEGLTFLNFRPRKDTTYITREEFQEQRRQKHAAP